MPLLTEVQLQGILGIQVWAVTAKTGSGPAVGGLTEVFLTLFSE